MLHPRARSGFTIVELAIVLAILGLIAGLAAPRYAAAEARYRLKAAAYRIASDMDMARTAARASSGTVSISFTPGAGGYYQITHLPAAVGPDPYTVDLSQDPYRVTLTKADFSGSTSLKVYPYGTAADGDILLQGRGITATVHVSADPSPTTVQITGP